MQAKGILFNLSKLLALCSHNLFIIGYPFWRKSIKKFAFGPRARLNHFNTPGRHIQGTTKTFDIYYNIIFSYKCLFNSDLTSQIHGIDAGNQVISTVMIEVLFLNYSREPMFH